MGDNIIDEFNSRQISELVAEMKTQSKKKMPIMPQLFVASILLSIVFVSMMLSQWEDKGIDTWQEVKVELAYGFTHPITFQPIIDFFKGEENKTEEETAENMTRRIIREELRDVGVEVSP